MGLDILEIGNFYSSHYGEEEYSPKASMIGHISIDLLRVVKNINPYLEKFQRVTKEIFGKEVTFERTFSSSLERAKKAGISQVKIQIWF